MAVTNADILGWFNANPGASDELIAKTMQEAGVTPAQLAQATGTPTEDVAVRYAAAVAPTVTDYRGKEYDTATIVKLAQQITPAIDPNAIRGGAFSTSGESIGFNYDEATKILGKPPTAAEQVILDMARHLVDEDVTDISQVEASDTNRRFGSTYTGNGGTIYEIKKDEAGNPVISTWGKSTSDKGNILAALSLAGLAFGVGGGFEGLFGGGATAGGLTAAEAAGLGLTSAEAAGLGLSASEFAAAGGGLLGGTVGTTGLTMAELAQLDLALGGAGGTAGATSLANALATGAAIPTITSLTGGSGVLTGAAGGITADSVASKLAADAGVTGMGTGTGLLAGAGGLGLSTTGAGLGAAGTGAGLTTGALTGAGTGVGTGLGTTLAGVGTGVGTGLGSTLAGVGTGVGTALGTAATTGLGGLTAAQLGSLLSGGLTLGGGLMQSQTSREAAQQAQARIDAETAAAKQAAAFRPVGMTTRFGTSEFKVDPVTGQITSAGYTLSPEAKAAQDRLVNLAGAGLIQAEQAQQQFAPLQTGAQNLFNLGNQYIAQSPEQVAQNYLNQQMALLQPGRELELANLQNKLQQQGRGGLAVAQGGSYGATTPELQALYNARAMQEAQLAANAQQAGQQQVQFGAGLLGTGAQTMGNYYAGQQAAYAPYTTALGQVQALEAAGQQPFTMGAQLGQTAATAGANVGRLGLAGAELSAGLATGQAATNNPYASLLAGLGGSNTFGTAAGNILGNLFSSTPAMTALSTPATSFGAGNYYGNQDLGLFL